MPGLLLRRVIYENSPRLNIDVPLYTVDLATWDDGVWADPSSFRRRTGPRHVDDPWPYRFTIGDSVWIRSPNCEWYRGTIVNSRPRQGLTEDWGIGLWWCVEFFANPSTLSSRWFAPLNGVIKPDDHQTEELLTNSE